jgi:hypothetical protein
MFKNILNKNEYPFDEILVVNEGDESNTKVKMGQQAISDSKFLNSYIRDTNNDRIYSFGDNKVIDQYIMDKSSRSTTCIYVEDGLGAYFNGGLMANKSDSSIRYIMGEKVKSFNLKINVMLYLGFIFKNVDDHGESKYIDEINLLYPKLGRDNYSTNTIKPINLTNGDLDLLYKFSNENIKNFDGEHDKLETVFIFPKLRLISESQMSKLSDLVYEYNKNGKVAVKYHPSSSRKITLPDDVIELSKDLPAEMFYITNLKTIKNIIGFPSTALMTASFFPLKNISKIVSFPPIVNRFQYKQKMEAIGIQILNNEQ